VWVAEQIPGLTLAKDVTQTLERGYWPSYNVPYFREVRGFCQAASAMPTVMMQEGNSYVADPALWRMVRFLPLTSDLVTGILPRAQNLSIVSPHPPPLLEPICQTQGFPCAQIYDQAGYQEFRDVHFARGPDFAAALSGLSYQLVRRPFCPPHMHAPCSEPNAAHGAMIATCGSQPRDCYKQVCPSIPGCGHSDWA